MITVGGLLIRHVGEIGAPGQSFDQFQIHLTGHLHPLVDVLVRVLVDHSTM